ncbi:MAG: hypothetical protein ABSB73_00840 [Solirubrobacteraceae bacterium]
MRARVLTTACFTALAAAAVPALAAGGAARVVGNCDRSQVRPATIWISCNDPSFSLQALRWSAFGGPSARATGVVRLESCPSACIPSAVREYPVVLVLTDARRCPDGHDDYRLADLSYDTSARPPGSAAKPPPLVLFCPLTD